MADAAKLHKVYEIAAMWDRDRYDYPGGSDAAMEDIYAAVSDRQQESVMTPIKPSPDFWTGLGTDPDLQRARELLSMDELRRIYQHAIGSQTATEPPLTDIQRSVLDGTFGVKSASGNRRA